MSRQTRVLALTAMAVVILGTGCIGNHGSSDDKNYVDCGDGTLCEVIIVGDKECILKPCGSDYCISCEEEQKQENDYIKVSPSALTVSEVNQSGIISISMLAEPSAPVSVTAKVLDETEIELDLDSFVIEPANWKNAQKIYVSGIDDGERDGDVNTAVEFSFASEDARFASLEPLTVEVKCIDDGRYSGSDVIVKQYTYLETSEDGKHVAKLGVHLAKKPTSTVTLNVMSSDVTEGAPDKAVLSFDASNYSVEQILYIHGVDDNESDGNQQYTIRFNVVSEDARYAGASVESLTMTNFDNEDAYPSGTYKIRLMAANTTSGGDQSYEDGPGIRIFQALKPDIVLIQEFNYGNNSEESIRQFVDTAFGPEYSYYRGGGSIPNGIISRYDIISSGGWSSNVVTNRRWEWAVIDLPGHKDLLAISLHLHTDDNASEMRPLITKIQSKMTADQQNYYLAVGGDFNTKTRSGTEGRFTTLFTVNSPYPADQNGNEYTNSSRTSPYDWLLFSPELDKLEVPVVIGKHSYSSGHVFDSRVYHKGCALHSGVNELPDVPPVQASDSRALEMQHMPVIRDIQIVVE